MMIAVDIYEVSTAIIICPRQTCVFFDKVATLPYFQYLITAPYISTLKV